MEPIDTVGGLSLRWRADVAMDIIFSSKNIIDPEITFVDLGTTCRVTHFYGHPYYSEK